MHFYFVLYCLLCTYSFLSKRNSQKALNLENDNICNFILTPHPLFPQMFSLSLSYSESIFPPQIYICLINLFNGKEIYETLNLVPNQLNHSTSALDPSYIQEINHTELTTSSPLLTISAHSLSKPSYHDPYKTHTQKYNYMRSSKSWKLCMITSLINMFMHFLLRLYQTLSTETVRIACHHFIITYKTSSTSSAYSTSTNRTEDYKCFCSNIYHTSKELFSFTYYFNILIYILCILFVFSVVLVSLNIVSILILAFILTILLRKIIYANNFLFSISFLSITFQYSTSICTCKNKNKRSLYATLLYFLSERQLQLPSLCG